MAPGERLVSTACMVLATGCGRLGFDVAPDPGTSRPGSPNDSAGGAAGAGGRGAQPFPLDGGPSTATGGSGSTLSDGGTTDAIADVALTDGALPAHTVSAVCGFDALTIIQDGNAADDAASATLAAAIRNGCGTTPTVRTVSQDAPGILDPGSGRPLLGPDDLGVTAGGPSRAQRAIQYLNMADTPLHLNLSQPGTYAIDERATGTSVVSAPQSTLGPTHDFAMVMIVYEPISQTTVVSTYARGSEGTRAGAFWFASGAPGPIARDARRWYVVEWTNADRTPGPSAGDSFTVVASG